MPEIKDHVSAWWEGKFKPWINDKVLPWLKNDFPIHIENGIRGAIGLAGKFNNWLKDVFTPWMETDGVRLISNVLVPGIVEGIKTAVPIITAIVKGVVIGTGNAIGLSGKNGEESLTSHVAESGFRYAINGGTFKSINETVKIGENVVDATKNVFFKPTSTAARAAAKVTGIGLEKGAGLLQRGLGAIDNKTGLSKISQSITKATGNASDNLVLGFIEKISGPLTKFLSNETIQKVFGKLGPKLPILGEKITESLLKNGIKASAKVAARIGALATTAGILNVGFAVADFISGFNNARSIMGITEEPSIGMRLAAATIKTLNGFFLFGIIPEKILMDIVLDFLAPILGINNTQLQQKRENAKVEVDNYNKEHNTKYSIEQYNHKVLGDATIGEKIKDVAGKAWDNTKTGAKWVGSKITNGAQSAWNVISEGVSTFGDKFGDFFSGIVSLGKYMKDTIIFQFKSAIDIKTDKDVQAIKIDKKDPLYHIKDMIFKWVRIGTLIPFLITKFGKSLNDKLGTLFSTIWDAVKNITASISDSFKMAWNGDIKGYFSHKNSESGVTGVLKNVGFYLTRFIMLPLTLPTALIGGAVNSIKNVWDNVKTQISYSSNLVKETFTKAWNGDIKGYFTMDSNVSGNEFTSILKTVQFYLTRFISLPIALPTALIGGIVHNIGNLWNGIKKIAGYTTSAITDTMKKAWDGDIKGYFVMDQNQKETGFTGVLKTVQFYLTRILMLPVTLPTALIGGAVKGASTVFDKLKNSYTFLENENKNISAIINGTSNKDYWEYDNSDGVNKFIFYTSRIMNAPGYYIQLLMNKVLNNGIIKKIKDGFGIISEMFNGIDYLNPNAQGSGFVGRGSAKSNVGHYDDTFVSQVDPKYANKRFNTKKDTIAQTIADSGCAPASATMLINKVSGAKLSMNEATNYALKYKVQNSGVDASYFKDIFSKYGMETQYYNSNDKTNMLQQLRDGNPMILMGVNKTSTGKSVSPFGPNGHYIMATGLSKDGKYVIVNDPESRKGGSKYSIDNLMKNVQLGISTSGEGSKFNVRKYIGRDSGNIINQDLGYFSPVNAYEMDVWISKNAPKNSPFRNNGAIFIEASKISGLDPRYILAHAAVESAWGTSNIAKTKGNYFGIGAFNSSPMSSAKTFGKMLKTGIIEGAKWIKKNYYNKGQTSLYNMIYGDPKHIYAQYDDGKPNDGWLTSISRVMVTGPENTKIKIVSKGIVKNTENLRGNLTGLLDTAFNMSNMSRIYDSDILNVLDYSSENGFISSDDYMGDLSTGGARSANDWFINQQGASKVSSDYGMRMHPVYHVVKMHNGIDYDYPMNTPIKSPISGTVVANNYSSTAGNWIGVRDSKGYTHKFLHMAQKSKLKVGISVRSGDIIGYVGNTGTSTGPHLHYGISDPSDKYINPNEYQYPIGNGSNKRSNINKILSNTESNPTSSTQYNMGQADVTGERQISNQIAKFDSTKIQVFEAIVKVLTKVATNTDQLNTIVTLLSNYFENNTSIKTNNKQSTKSNLGILNETIRYSSSKINDSDTIELIRSLEKLAAE
jgi:murein DD-endopeptidase MepM/ murein hydrolase activator NlpD